MSNKLVAAVAGVILLSGCATSGSPDPAPTPPLTGAQIKQLLDNAEIEGTGWDGSPYVAHHKADGRVTASWGKPDNSAAGTWRVDGNAVCVAWDKQFQDKWASGCWTVEKTQQGTERFIETQGPKPGQVTVTDAVIRGE